MKNVMILLMIFLISCKEDKGNKSAASVVAPEASAPETAMPVVSPTPVAILDSAKAFVKASAYTSPMDFGAYTFSGMATVVSDYFDYVGGDGVVLSGVSELLNGNAFTLVNTIDVLSWSDEQILFSLDNGTQVLGTLSYVNGKYKAYFYFGDNTSYMYFMLMNIPSTAISSNKFVVTVVLNNMDDFSSGSVKHVKFYIDGVEYTGGGEYGTMVSMGTIPDVQGSQKLYINQDIRLGFKLSGRVYNFGIFDKALSGTEVMELYDLVK